MSESLFLAAASDSNLKTNSVYAVNATNGAALWNYNRGGNSLSVSPIISDEGHLIVGNFALRKIVPCPAGSYCDLNVTTL